MTAGTLLYRWWLSQRKPQVKDPSYLIVNESPLATDAKNLELLKKDTQDRQKLQASTPDWEDNWCLDHYEKG